MNKIFASVGLAALIASSIPAVFAQSTANSPPPPKAWNISASLRGFYDDNINSVPSNKQDSTGFEVSPGASLNLLSDQTSFTLGFLYTFKYYDTKPTGNVQHYDQIFSFDGALDHRFSERYQMAIKDSFVIGQEPDILRPIANGPFTSFQRIPGDNIRNYGAIVFNGQFTPVFGMEAGYANAYFNYDDKNPTFGPPFVASQSGTSDRLEHHIHLDGRWLLSPDTTGVLGYQFSLVDYTGNEIIGFLPSGPLMSDDRNSMSHYGYAGLDHKFNPDLAGSIRGGAQYIDFFNDPNGQTDVSPYVLANLRYSYAVESYAEAGFSYNRNSTDQINTDPANNSFTRDETSAIFYGTVRHRLLPRLFGGVIGQIQHSTYNGGSVDGDVDMFYAIGLSLEYRFNAYLSANAGYNFDRLDADTPNRSFSRNRVYIGLTARY